MYLGFCVCKRVCVVNESCIKEHIVHCFLSPVLKQQDNSVTHWGAVVLLFDGWNQPTALVCGYYCVVWRSVAGKEERCTEQCSTPESAVVLFMCVR